MKAKFKLISTLLIVWLMILLVVVLVAYYNKPINIDDNPINNIASTNHTIKKVISENTSGEISMSTSGEASEEVSGDGSVIISGEITLPEPSSVIESDDEKDSTVIITSEDTMTNKEKRQILTELDNALMELLDVVDKVQTVDETRLITGESEVQE